MRLNQFIFINLINKIQTFINDFSLISECFRRIIKISNIFRLKRLKVLNKFLDKLVNVDFTDFVASVQIEKLSQSFLVYYLIELFYISDILTQFFHKTDKFLLENQLFNILS